MSDYDVIVIGGGINGLSCAAYLGKAGLKTLLLEAKGQCGAHCDTIELGEPGFLHNTHATMMASAMSPQMGDLDLEKYGAEFVQADLILSQPFLDGTNIHYGNAFDITARSWEKHSKKDGNYMWVAKEYCESRLDELTELIHLAQYGAPNPETAQRLGGFMHGFYSQVAPDHPLPSMMGLDGFECADLIFENDKVKAISTMLNFAGGNGAVHHKGMGAMGYLLATLTGGAVLPFHYIKGGSHEFTHALVKAAVAAGVTIWPSCPVGKIIVKDNACHGVVLSDRAVYGAETITAKTVVSNVSFLPTFVEMIGEEALGSEIYNKAKTFRYDENVTFSLNMELDEDPVFISADYDDGVQKAPNGWLGVESGKELWEHTQANTRKEITNKPCLEWFIPTRVDPGQAPPGYHTASMLFDIPPDPKSWNGEKLDGINCWDDIKERVADLMIDIWDKYAPGFKKLVRKRHVASPLDIQRNNPSAVYGHMAGGAMIPSQSGPNRPLAGICEGGASRTYIKNLYLSNSIHPNGQSGVSSGYIAASEVAEDMGAREQSWWKYQAFQWLLENKDKITVIK